MQLINYKKENLQSWKIQHKNFTLMTQSGTYIDEVGTLLVVPEKLTHLTKLSQRTTTAHFPLSEANFWKEKCSKKNNENLAERAHKIRSALIRETFYVEKVALKTGRVICTRIIQLVSDRKCACNSYEWIVPFSAKESAFRKICREHDPSEWERTGQSFSVFRGKVISSYYPDNVLFHPSPPHLPSLPIPLLFLYFSAHLNKAIHGQIPCSVSFQWNKRYIWFLPSVSLSVYRFN